jgi:hypothetical protein
MEMDDRQDTWSPIADSARWALDEAGLQALAGVRAERGIYPAAVALRTEVGRSALTAACRALRPLAVRLLPDASACAPIDSARRPSGCGSR